ncbi:YbaB/EbfC family nucleoid-associated protein [Thermomonospora cellulosilytica]|uniref:DNA-binding protein YbaB n=1 Tax=Thermomonospora cellulosilytica TaxID=1411118 RepID=A0A7W3MW65_9ACTN|nr:YbaB/EbfC family nucleoid-associated protein [Thermomonospora cellulosilytica]MBA9002917.1 DNA-binding protein YbaB [Thermomonospora cellulosilytica]
MIDFDPEEILRASERYAEKVRRAADEMDDLVGRAESEDGRIRVEWTDEQGVAKLEIDPRALRMASTELADVIAATIGRARADLAAKADMIAAEIFGPDGDPEAMVDDAETIQAQIDDFQAAFNGTLQDTSRILDSLNRFLGK